MGIRGYVSSSRGLEIIAVENELGREWSTYRAEDMDISC